jgi:acyl carrier protein phosphodiesterase
MLKGQNGAIFVEVALLTIIVILVDETLLRTGLAFVPAMLLAQRASSAAEAPASESVSPEPERRADVPSRRHLEDFLSQFREFYATCHLLGSGEISSDDALERTTAQERSLNQLLAQVTAATKERARLGA